MKTDKKTILGIAAFLIVLVACASLVFLPKTALGEEPTDVEKSDSKVFYPTYVQEGYDSMIEWKKDVKDCSEATVTKGQGILDSYKDYFSDEQKSELQSLIDKAGISSCFARLNEYGTELDQWETKGQQAKEEAERVAAEKAAAEAAAKAKAASATKSISNTSSKAQYQAAVASGNYSGSYSDFMRAGVVYSNGNKYTYYSQRVLPGGGLKIPGRHVDGGFVKDADGYICVASDKAYGTIVSTPFGQGRCYDQGTSGNHYDIYVE